VVVNPRPRLNAYQRHLVCERVRTEGWSVIAAAQAAGVSRQTVHKWLQRFAQDGPAGLADRSSRPARMPRLTRIDLAVRICWERVERQVGPHELALLLGIARSTIYAVLRRAELNRLGALVAKLRVLRYEWPAPGDLVHLDIKRFGRIPEDGGWRNVGRPLANRIKRQAGYEYCHVAVDDHSRLPDAVLLGDQRGASAVAALEQVWGRYLRAGRADQADPHRQRQLLSLARLPGGLRAVGHRALADPSVRVRTDNGPAYKSFAFRDACAAAGVRHTRTKARHPWTNGRAERFIGTIQRECAYRDQFSSDAERALAIALFVPWYNTQRPHIALGGLTPQSRLDRWRVTQVYEDLS